MTDAQIKARVRAHEWPRISADVRARVMSTAVVPAGAVSWSERVWFSTAWRLTAAALVLLVLGWDQVATVTPERRNTSARLVAESRAIEDTAREVGLEAETAAWLAQRSLLEAVRRAPATQPGAAFMDTMGFDSTGGL